MGIDAHAVRRVFSHLEFGAGDAFFEHVADDVDWTVEGAHPLAGHYRSKQEFHAHTIARLNRILPGGTQRHVQSVFTDSDRAVVKRRSHATAVNGMRYDNRECWVMRFVGELIVEVRACLDSALVQTLIDDNHG
jgi:uncharacterized protein